MEKVFPLISTGAVGSRLVDFFMDPFSFSANFLFQSPGGEENRDQRRWHMAHTALWSDSSAPSKRASAEPGFA